MEKIEKQKIPSTFPATLRALLRWKDLSFEKWKLLSIVCVQSLRVDLHSFGKLIEFMKRCDNVRSSATDIRIPENFESFEYIRCIEMDTEILLVPENFENF